MIVKALAILLLACLIGLGVQTWRASHYRTQAITFKSAVLTFKSAQKTNLATIAKLQSANEAWAGKYAADVAKASKEAQDATAYAEQQHKAAQSAQKALHDLSQAHPEVRAWADGVVPPSVVRVLTGSQD
jgi:hypothetical protein